MINNKKITITTCFLAATGMAIIPNTALANNDPVIENIESAELAIGSTFTHENIIYKVIAKNDNNIEVQVGDGTPITNVSGLLRLNGNFNKDNKNFVVTQIGEAAFSGQDSKITEIVIPNTVVKINNKAFQAAEKLQKVTFENNSSLILIGDEAFESANQLYSIDIPDSVKNIGAYAFSSAASLTNVNIKDTSSLTEIGEGAFIRSETLKSINIPKNVTNIGNRALSNNNSLESITVNPENKVYKSFNGGLYDIANEKLIVYPAASKNEEYTIMVGTKIIGSHAFTGAKNLKNVVMPDSIIKVEDNAFSKAKSLENVKFSNNLKEIGKNAFVQNYKLKEIILPDSINKLGLFAFDDLKSVEKIYIGKSLNNLNSGNFRRNFPSLKQVIIASENPNINKDSMSFLSDKNNKIEYIVYSEDAKLNLEKAIYNNLPRNLSEENKKEIISKYNISKKGIQVGDIIENNNVKYKIISIADDIIKVAIGDGQNFVDTNSSNFNIPENFDYNGKNVKVTEISSKAFAKGSNIINLTIPNSINKIQNDAFSENEKIVHLELPDSITEIDGWAFDSMKELKTIKLPKNIKTLKAYVFYKLPKLEELFIPESVTEIEGTAISNLNALKKLYVGKNVSMLNNGFLAGEFDSLKVIGLANKNLQSHGDAVPLAEVLDFKILVTSKESQAIAKVAFDKENIDDIIIVDENKVLDYVKNYPNIDVLNKNEQPKNDDSTIEQPKNDNSTVEQPKNDNSTVEQPKNDNSTVEQPKADKLKSVPKNAPTATEKPRIDIEMINNESELPKNSIDEKPKFDSVKDNSKTINEEKKSNAKVLPNTGEMVNNNTILLSLLSISTAAFLLIRKKTNK